jgi:Na+/H+-dicarboxylate symporter
LRRAFRSDISIRIWRSDEADGDAFIKLVKMIIAPVIFLTIATGIAGMRDLASVGRVAGKAFAYFLTFSTLALFVGLIVANVVHPGTGLNIDPSTLDASKVADYAEKAHETTVTGFLVASSPTLSSALTEGSILQRCSWRSCSALALHCWVIEPSVWWRRWKKYRWPFSRWWRL